MRRRWRLGVFWGSPRNRNTRENESILNEDQPSFSRAKEPDRNKLLCVRKVSSNLTALLHPLLQGSTAMERREETKDAIDYVEDSASRKQAFADDEMPLPSLLEGLNVDELKKIGRRATWKLDVIIMPAMTMSATVFTIASIRG
jgi:hypothetical protein